MRHQIKLTKLTKEGLLPLADVPELIQELYPYWPNAPTYQSCWRWTRVGVNGTKLESLKILNLVYTSRPAVRRFVDAMMVENATHAQEPQTATPE